MSSRTFRIFVSSTFSDLKAERDALQREVFPKLKELCLKHGCRFQAIDLRGGERRGALGAELPCPKCSKPLKLNPFTINADWRPIARAWQGGNEGFP